MRLRIAAVLFVAVSVPASWPSAATGSHNKNADFAEVVEVEAETPPQIDDPEKPFVFEHRFTPAILSVHRGGKVEFTNTDIGPPHTWTLVYKCDPSKPDSVEGKCDFDSQQVSSLGGSVVVDLRKLPPGNYTFVCRMNQGGDSPFPPHATKGKEGWEGMVGELTVK